MAYMFTNIGGKIKLLAEILCMIGIGASFLFGTIMIINDANIISAFLVAACGTLSS